MPGTFEEGVNRFCEFLQNNGYAKRVMWAGRDDVVWSRIQLWVREYSDSRTWDARCKRYSKGVACGLGVGLEAVASTKDATVAFVLLPKDRDEMQRMMPHGGLKLSALVAPPRSQRVPNPLRWVVLCRWFRKSTQAFLDSREMLEEV